MNSSFQVGVGGLEGASFQLSQRLRFPIELPKKNLAWIIQLQLQLFMAPKDATPVMKSIEKMEWRKEEGGLCTVEGCCQEASAGDQAQWPRKSSETHPSFLPLKLKTVDLPAKM